MCRNCSIKSVYEFTNKRKLCKNCYIKWFEKKVFYTIRKYNMLKSGDVIGYSKKNDFRSVVLEKILKMLTEKGRIRLTKSKKYDKFAVPVTVDSTASEILTEIIKNSLESDEIKPEYKKIIKPLYLFLDREVELYAKLKNLKFKKIKTKETKISNFLDEIEKKHPEVKRAVVRGILDLQ